MRTFQLLQKGIVSKGVDSVSSPVRNLRDWDACLTHQSFLDAVADQFIHVYGGQKSIKEIDDSQLQTEAHVRTMYDELRTWDWQWGQTPEFTNTLDASFPWGDIVRTRIQLVRSDG